MFKQWILSVLAVTGTCCAFFGADLDEDRYVGLGDLAIIAAYWLDNGNVGCNGDTGTDCKVDMTDLAKLAEQWQWMECVSTATASSQESGSYPASAAIDGSLSTRWSSSFNDNQWLQIDLGQTRTLYGLTIYWEAAYAKVYNVRLSNNASTWTTVYTDSNGNGGTDDITFAEQSARYIRINCVTRQTQYGSSIYEVTLKSNDCCRTPTVEWELVWSDEFDGTTIKTANWNWEIGAGGWGNNELQYYTNSTENSYINNGSLVIVARKNHLGHDYTSARMTTKNKQSFLYGRLEASIKLPALKQGIWPAFWMMPADSVYGGWAASGEIDIMEAINQPYTVYGTIHYGGSWPNNQYSGGEYSNGTDFSQGYHTYAIEWEPTQIRWYVDDVLYSTKTSWYTSGYPYPAPFDKPFFFILNLAVGGNWPGYPDATTTFPQTMYIDYVRVYQAR